MKNSTARNDQPSSEKEHTHPRNYVYTNSFGEAVHRKVRHDQPKRFVWEHLNDEGNWIPGIGAGEERR